MNAAAVRVLTGRINFGSMTGAECSRLSFVSHHSSDWLVVVPGISDAAASGNRWLASGPVTNACLIFSAIMWPLNVHFLRRIIFSL